MENQHTTDPARRRSSQPRRPTASALPGLRTTASTPTIQADRSSSRKALWISVAALAAVGAVAGAGRRALHPAPSRSTCRHRPRLPASPATRATTPGRPLTTCATRSPPEWVWTRRWARSTPMAAATLTASSSWAVRAPTAPATRALDRIFGLLDDATDGVSAITTEPAGHARRRYAVRARHRQ